MTAMNEAMALTGKESVNGTSESIPQRRIQACVQLKVNKFVRSSQSNNYRLDWKSGQWEEAS